MTEVENRVGIELPINQNVVTQEIKPIPYFDDHYFDSRPVEKVSIPRKLIHDWNQ